MKKAQWLNAWTRETFLKQIEKMNGFELCTNGTDCYYRHPETKKACLVGAFIPDDKYNIEMEGVLFDGYSVLFRDIDFPLDGLFMYELQRIHDDLLYSNFEEKYKTDNLKQAIINYLDKYGLN